MHNDLAKVGCGGLLEPWGNNQASTVLSMKVKHGL